MSASRIAFTSAEGSFGAVSGASAVLSTIVLRVADGVRRVGGTRPLVHANRAERARLEHTNELQPDHFEQRDERDDETAAIVDVGKQILEAHRFALRQPGEQLLDADFDRNLLRREQHLWPHLRAIDDGLERGEQAEEIDFEL